MRRSLEQEAPRVLRIGGGPDLDAFARQVATVCWQVSPTVPGLREARLAPRRGLRGLFQGQLRPSFAEACRLIALTVRQMAAKRPLKTIAVMGAYPGDGRTTVAANLGIFLAEMGERVVLVDADVRRPGLAALLPGDPVAGEGVGPDGAPAAARNAAEAGGQAAQTPGRPGRPGTPGAALAQTDPEGPFVTVTAGGPGLALLRLSRAEGGLFPPEVLAALLAALRTVADFIILDTPPCLAYADAFYAAPLVNGVLYVVRRRQQDVAEQRRVQAQLAQLGANVLGVVLNEA